MSDKMWICPECKRPTIQTQVEVFANIGKGDPNGIVHPVINNFIIPTMEPVSEINLGPNDVRCSSCGWCGPLRDTEVDYSIVIMGVAHAGFEWEDFACYIPEGADPVGYVTRCVPMQPDVVGIFVVKDVS